MILGNWNFYVFSFSNQRKCDLGYEHEATHSSFPGAGSSSPLIHPPSVIPDQFFILHLFLFLCTADCMSHTLWRKQPLSILHVFFYFRFFLSIFVCTAGDEKANVSFDRLHWLTLLPRLSSFSLSPSQTYSSQYLPVLSKCYCKVFQWDDSKYVYINRGNTLGYILLTSCVAWSLYPFLVSV